MVSITFCSEICFAMPLPAIALRHENGAVEVVKEFGYQDFKGRLS